jgi:DNA-binding CsgD family transcriptional regulator
VASLAGGPAGDSLPGADRGGSSQSHEPRAVSAATQDSIHGIWDELSDFESARSEQAVARLMARLCDLGGAWNATWAGAIRVDGSRQDDPLEGWRVAAVKALHPVAPHPDEGHFKDILRVWDQRKIDPSFLLPMRGVGTFRTYSFRRELPPEWFESPFYKVHYGSVGTSDAVFVAFPLNQEAESHFGFYSRKAFGDDEIARLAYALRGIKWFHRHLMLSHGLLLASSPLTPTERKVLQLLLTDATEKHIAHQVEMAASTAHQYIVGIYRKFGVRSRAGLMSLWLNRGG